MLVSLKKYFRMMDLVRTILRDRIRFARTIFDSKLPKPTKIRLLQLAKRSKRDLILDVICEYFYTHFGVVPLQHERLVVPKEFLPKEFTKWYLGILKEIS